MLTVIAPKLKKTSLPVSRDRALTDGIEIPAAPPARKPTSTVTNPVDGLDGGAQQPGETGLLDTEARRFALREFSAMNLIDS
jgi:hypothetical protein